MSVRPFLHDALRGVVDARLALESLRPVIIEDMQAGMRPTYRGHEWNRETFDLLQGANEAIEIAFHLLKAVQWPETKEGRQIDAEGPQRRLGAMLEENSWITSIPSGQ